MFIDSHCHLDKLDLSAREGGLEGALDDARAAGVSGFLCVGAEPTELADVVALAAERDDVWASAGIHPLAVTGDRSQREAVTAVLDQVVAIGETGLDFFKQDNDVDAQLADFAWHLEEGGRRGLPVIVHTRAARQATIATIRRHGAPDVAGVLHCFAEDWETAAAAMDLGYYVSISGIVTFRSAEALRDVVRRLPAERLLVETDAPWLSPAPHRGRPNEPMRVRRVAECVAELRGEPLEAIAEQTTENFFRLFSRAAPVAAAPPQSSSNSTS
ncbi:MAG: TatD family hydrolase [Pseudomonadales bacterium]|jgi:TatD DNase family protein|nr:TatD family hydrolase [Pseudomonadales bacterium]